MTEVDIWDETTGAYVATPVTELTGEQLAAVEQEAANSGDRLLLAAVKLAQTDEPLCEVQALVGGEWVDADGGYVVPSECHLADMLHDRRDVEAGGSTTVTAVRLVAVADGTEVARAEA